MNEKIEFEATAEQHAGHHYYDCNVIDGEDFSVIGGPKLEPGCLYHVTLELVGPKPEPCPLCGSKARLIDNHGTPGVMCSCPNCRVRLFAPSKRIALHRWNLRCTKAKDLHSQCVG